MNVTVRSHGGFLFVMYKLNIANSLFSEFTSLLILYHIPLTSLRRHVWYISCLRTQTHSEAADKRRGGWCVMPTVAQGGSMSLTLFVYYCALSNEGGGSTASRTETWETSTCGFWLLMFLPIFNMVIMYNLVFSVHNSPVR